MHVMNCLSLANDKENGALSVAAGLMSEDPPAASPPPPPPCPPAEAPPAPPLPPPPPPLPGPSLPLHSQLTNGHDGHSRKKRMRSFFWKTIPEEQVRGKTNIWTIAARPQYQIDTKTIEELFGQQEETKPPDPRSRSLKASFKETKEEVRTKGKSLLHSDVCNAISGVNSVWPFCCSSFLLQMCSGLKGRGTTGKINSVLGGADLFFRVLLFFIVTG